MKESGIDGFSKQRLRDYLHSLINYVRQIKDPDKKQVSIVFCITNLVLASYDEIEALGLLEKAKVLLGEVSESMNPSEQLSRLSYIS